MTDPGPAASLLYHVPAPGHAVRELRRITRPGGRVIVALNGEDHLGELRGFVVPDPEPLVEAVADRLQAAPGAVFRVTTHSGCLICA